MTWYYELDASNAQVKLRYVDDSDTIHGPFNLSWPDAPARTTTPDGWLIDPQLKEFSGDVMSDEWATGNQLLAIQMLRDTATGDVQEGTPS